MSEVGISVVVPAYDEGAVIRETLGRLASVLEAEGERWEIVVVDDGSQDDTVRVVEDLARERSGIVLLELSRNFGHQAAVSAGLAEARGAWVGVIDADLQDPPEVLATMLARAREGHDVVYGVRSAREAPLLMRFLYWLYYRVLRMTSDRAPPLDAGDFCVMSRRVVDAINALPERGRYLRGLRHWVGFRQVGVPYERPARAGGDSKYGGRRLVALAQTGFLSSTRIPLRLVAYLGFALAVAGFVWAVKVVIWKFAYDTAPDGFTALMVAMLVLGGTQLVAIGVIGQYLGRVLDQVEGRPHYVVRSLSRGESEEDSA